MLIRALLVAAIVTNFVCGSVCPPAIADDLYHTDGELAGSLRTAQPAIYDPDPAHLWNRLFAAFYVRESNLPGTAGGQPVKRLEGGDTVDFLGWSGTTYWSQAGTCERLSAVLDEFLSSGGERLIDDPLRRAILLRDLWAAFDFLVGQNIDRFGAAEELQRRDALCRRLALAIRALALTDEQIAALPDTYDLAIRSGAFAADHGNDAARDYLPPGLLTDPAEWAEIDFYQPDLHEDLSNRFVTLHTRTYRGRSYFRIFYRFPGGREQLNEYLAYLDAEGVDWRQAAHEGFIRLRPGVRQMPVGVEAALVQTMITLDRSLRPTPTRIVESVRLRTFPNVEGVDDPPTNSGVGMNVSEYLLKRRLLFDGLKQGGLAREADDLPQYRVIFQARRGSPDWGPRGRQETVRQQCVSCHTGFGSGVHTLVSIVHMGGFDAGAQMGIAHAIPAGTESPRAARDVKFKTENETYRRLLEYVERENVGRDR